MPIVVILKLNLKSNSIKCTHRCKGFKSILPGAAAASPLLDEGLVKVLDLSNDLLLSRDTLSNLLV